MSFGNITKQAPPPHKTVELVVNQLVGDPVLIVEHLGETNAEFYSDALAKANAEAAGTSRARAKSNLTPQQVAEARLKNRETVAKYAVRDLRGFFHDAVVGADGLPEAPRAATKADIRDVVMALPNDVFDTVLAFVVNPENFRDRPIEGDPKALAGK